MSRPCPNCRTPCAMEARFCRLCGTPLRPPVATGETVKPGANTAPLADEGRTTHGLPTDDGSASAPETARVRRTELESILRRHAASAPSKSAPNNSHALENNEAVAAPVTTSLAAAKEGERDAEAATGVRPQHAREAVNGEEKRAGAGDAASLGRAAGPSAAKREARPRRRGLLLAGLALAALATGVGALAFYYWRGGSSQSGTTTTPASAADQKRAMEERLSEAETMLAEGRTTEAISRLRAAIRLEPSNARAHRLLAEALERTGAVNEAIDEYRAAAERDPGNEDTLLRYADALRRVGRTDEASEIYQKLSSSSSPEVARLAKEQMETVRQTQSASNGADASNANSPRDTGAEGAGTTEPPSSSSSSSTREGASAPPANGDKAGSTGAAKPKNDPAGSYATAMKIIEGKDIRKMSRAELIRAYELFQYAQSGPRAAEANRHLRELDKELFERRKRKQ